jgi:hypothetical protein
MHPTVRDTTPHDHGRQPHEWLSVDSVLWHSHSPLSEAKERLLRRGRVPPPSSKVYDTVSKQAQSMRETVSIHISRAMSELKSSYLLVPGVNIGSSL